MNFLKFCRYSCFCRNFSRAILISNMYIHKYCFIHFLQVMQQKFQLHHKSIFFLQAPGGLQEFVKTYLMAISCEKNFWQTHCLVTEEMAWLDHEQIFSNFWFSLNSLLNFFKFWMVIHPASLVLRTNVTWLWMVIPYLLDYFSTSDRTVNFDYIPNIFH